MATNRPSSVPPVFQFQGARTPLGDATARVNNASSNVSRSSSKLRGHELEPNPLRPLKSQPSENPLYKASTSRSARGSTASIPAPAPAPASLKQKHSGAIQDENSAEDRRASQISTSTASSGKHKTHIGPWNLGRTLGRGSASRVRLARHSITGQLAAVKILPRTSGQMSQSGSLVELDKWDRQRGEFASENRIPLAIEREVAMLKLIDHPNIVKLYDIWENRQEIYLVLEYVEQGDLFSMINQGGAFREEQAMYLFRQVLSAVEYCHSFNICHRDLKPENILVSETGEAKVADFGMACIQQSPTHRLRTSCGSPHYAAPELVSNQHYRGDKVDVWSLGVILYAMLSCHLPFDHEETSVLLTMARKGLYRIPGWFSEEAKSLISKMIEVNPEKRISIRKIWQHPLLRKYDYLDSMRANGGQPPEIDKNRQSERVSPEDVDMQLVRQLKSLWHTYSEKFLVMKLSSPEPNDQKLFYWLLHSYREKRLENYGTDLTYSASDYHHLRPVNWTKKFTTVEFPSEFGRTASKFTVISTVATDATGEAIETGTEGGMTTRSYDPFKSSLNFDLHSLPSHAKIVVHRNGSLARASTRASSNRMSRLNTSIRTSSTYSRSFRGGRRVASSTGLGASRRTLNSIRSGESIPYTRLASRRQRGVDFSYVRKSIEHSRESGHRAPASIAGDDTTVDRDHTSPSSPVKRARMSRNSGRRRYGTQTVSNLADLREETPAWMDELRHLSDSIAKDCDDAFNSTLTNHEAIVDETTVEPSTMNFSFKSRTSPLSTGTPAPLLQGAKKKSQEGSRPWDARPLPRAPAPSDSVLHEISKVRSEAESRRGNTDESPGHVDRVLSHLERLTQPGDSSKTPGSERRATSAPIYSQYSTKWGRDTIPLPSIYETPATPRKREEPRVVSAPAETPVHRPTPFEERKGFEFLAQQENTIRVVASPSGSGYVEVPEPLRIRKKMTKRTASDGQSLDLRQQYRQDKMKEPIAEESSGVSRKTSNASTAKNKQQSWFKRGSKDREAMMLSRGNSTSSNGEFVTTDYLTQTETNSTAGPVLPPVKKKSFNFAFWRHNREQQPRMELSLAGDDFEESVASRSTQMSNRPSKHVKDKSSTDHTAKRNIEVQQNWLARLFRVKPATRYLCFTISRRQARQEIAILLREWRKYGIRDVQVDKGRNIIFARVSKNNYLDMGAVSFAVEIMTVIEHGKRNPLSIVRFTQERGAASSFHRVVDTMDTMFRPRFLLVEDKHKTKMMIKTLNS